MKKNYFVIVAPLAVVLLGAGCYGTSITSQSETNTPSANVPEINIVVPTNENVPPPANVNQPIEESPKIATVLLQNFSFSPPSVTIAAGGEVTWTNRDSVNHTVTGEDWGSELLGKDKSFTKKFETPGVYPYHCTPHPNMTGRVVVK
jgi:plastocyanin